MKFFILSFYLIFLAPLLLQAVVTDDDIISQHRQDFAQSHPGITPIYLDINSDAINTGQARGFLMVKSRDLKTQMQQLSTYFINHPKATLLIDFEKGDGFVSDSGEIKLDRRDLPQYIRSLWVSNKAQDIVRMGRHFLYGCSTLTRLNFSPLRHVTSIGDYFLTSCTGLASLDLLPLSHVTSIESSFLSRCTSLASLDLSPLRHVTSIGDYFLTSCTGLASLDLSPFSHITSIRSSFLSYCTGLTSLDLSPLSRVTSIGSSFLCKCDGLIALLLPERTIRLVLETAVKTLRESNVQACQDLGTQLYQRYLLQIPDDLGQHLAEINCDRLRAMTPKALADLPDIPGEEVVRGYNEMIQAAQLDESEARAYRDHLYPHLENLFLNAKNKVTWAIREQYKSQVKIAFKHILKWLKEFPQSHEEIKNFLAILTQGFQHCESRFIATLNQILMQMGLSSALSEDSVESKLWGLINEKKLEIFNNFVSDDDPDADAHSYGQQFTVVNNAVGLPVAIRNFQERMRSLSDEAIQEQLGLFFGGYFNMESLIEALYQKLTAADSTLSPQQLRSWMGQHEDMAVLTTLCPNFDEGIVDDYYLYWAECASDEFDYNKTPLTKGELGRLLVLMGVIKNHAEERMRRKRSHDEFDSVDGGQRKRTRKV